MPDTPCPNSPSFESALARIEEIVHELEEGQTGLAESLGRYEEAVRLLKNCYGLLEKAERRIELLVGTDAAGNPVTEPFDDTASTDRDQQAAPRSRRRSAPAPKSAPAESIAPPTPAADNRDVESAGELF
jgi:exodeoxyribonuclease VII small subunit